MAVSDYFCRSSKRKLPAVKSLGWLNTRLIVLLVIIWLSITVWSFGSPERFGFPKHCTAMIVTEKGGLIGGCGFFDHMVDSTTMGCMSVKQIITVVTSVAWVFGICFVLNKTDFQRAKEVQFEWERCTIFHVMVSAYIAVACTTSAAQSPNTLALGFTEAAIYYLVTWSHIFLSSKVPSSYTLKLSRQYTLCATLLVLPVVCLAAQSPEHLGRLFGCVFVFLMHFVVLLRSVVAGLRCPPSASQLREQLGFLNQDSRRMRHTNVLSETFSSCEQKRNLEAAREELESGAPGCLTAGLVGWWSLIWAFKASESLAAYYDEDNKLRSCLSVPATLLGLAITPLLVMLEASVHNIHWQSQVQRALGQAFGQGQNALKWEKFQFDPSEYTQDELIAAGMEGEVYRGTYNQGMRGVRSEEPDVVECCIKVPHIMGSDAMLQVLQETAILLSAQQLIRDDHFGKDHIVKLLGFCFQLPTVAVLLGLCSGGDLGKRLDSISRLGSEIFTVDMATEQAVQNPIRNGAAAEMPTVAMGSCVLSESHSLQRRLRWALQVARGMAALHSIRIAHMDLKVDNVLLKQDDSACVTDFGCALVIADVSQLHPANVGTPFCMAPEVHIAGGNQGNLAYDPLKADVFSFGFILYHCITLRREPNCRSVVKESAALPSTPIVLQPTELAGPWFDGCVDLEKPLFSLVQRCFAKDAKQRDSFEQIVETLEMHLLKVGDATKEASPIIENI